MRVDLAEQLGVSQSPLTHPSDRFMQSATQRREAILRLRRNHRERLSRYQAIALELAHSALEV